MIKHGLRAQVGGSLGFKSLCLHFLLVCILLVSAFANVLICTCKTGFVRGCVRELDMKLKHFY